jgi:hypothetical protein
LLYRKEGEEDVAALIAGQSAPETEAAKSETEKLLLHLNYKEEKAPAESASLPKELL